MLGELTLGSFGSALAQRIAKASADFARLMHSCGAHQRRDMFAEELSAMEQLLSGPSPGQT